MRRVLITIQGTLAFLLAALIMGVPAMDARADTASIPAGFYKVNCLGNSDTIVSIPFTRPEAAFALVGSIAGNGVTVSGTPGWLSNQFVYASGTQSNTYYLRLLGGDKEGNYYPITANGTNSLTISLGGDNISSVTNGTRLSVIPYWTLGSAFPAGKGAIPSANGIVRKTDILIPDVNGVGINLSAAATYYFVINGTFPNGIWQKLGTGTNSVNDDILLPDNYLIVRHNIASNTVLTAQGSVPVSKLSMPLSTETSTKQDNFIALTRPVTNTLDGSGLFQSGAFVASPNAISRADELLVFDNNQVAKNKSASETYYYLNTWRRLSSGVADAGGDPVFTPGTGVIVRKKATVSGATTNWINSPTY